MPIEAVRAVLQWERTSGLAEDTQTNTMHFFSLTLSRSAMQAVIEPAMATLVQVIDGRMDAGMFKTPMIVEYYDLKDPEPRIPYDSQLVALTMSAGTSLPMECSMVVSFQGPVISGVNRARRRGRIYLPTFSTNIPTDSGSRVVWTASDLTALTSAFASFGGTLDAAGVQWAVYSPTTHEEEGGVGGGDPALQAALVAVDSGWIDDEPDTQRRRGNQQSPTKSLFFV